MASQEILLCGDLENLDGGVNLEEAPNTRLTASHGYSQLATAERISNALDSVRHTINNRLSGFVHSDINNQEAAGSDRKSESSTSRSILADDNDSIQIEEEIIIINDEENNRSTCSYDAFEDCPICYIPFDMSKDEVFVCFYCKVETNLCNKMHMECARECVRGARWRGLPAKEQRNCPFCRTQDSLPDCVSHLPRIVTPARARRARVRRTPQYLFTGPRPFITLPEKKVVAQVTLGVFVVINFLVFVQWYYGVPVFATIKEVIKFLLNPDVSDDKDKKNHTEDLFYAEGL